MEFIIPQHEQNALSLWGPDPEKIRAESADRMARLEALDPEQLPMALTFSPRPANPGPIRQTRNP